MNSSIVFIAMAGAFRLLIEVDGVIKEYLLDQKSIVMLAPQASWIKAYDFSKDAVLIGLSDRKYADCQYISDYEKYRRLIKRG